MTSSRRLAAIMFADIVGYTAMMQRDEKGGMAKVDRFKEVIKEYVSLHQGDMIELRGDGCLCIFPSAVEALSAARSIQESIRHIVPLRIGVHLGDIVQKEGHIYGDGVNIASRIESLGVSGAILVSERVIPDIKSHPEFEMQSLGKFHFKNVDTSMEVFALANAGMVVPKKHELQGKLVRKRSKTWVPIMIMAVLLMGAATWQFFLKDNSSISIQEKRVAVMVFDNRTGDPSLDSYGNMISDWLTKGLMDTEGANVVRANNILAKVKAVATDDLESLEFAQELEKKIGVGITISGNYYLLGDSLYIHTNILDARAGEYIKVLDLHGHKTHMHGLLERLTQEVLGFWLVKEQARFMHDPPQVDAYLEFSKADPIHITDPKQATSHLENAYALDSTFFAPLFSLYYAYANTGQDSLKNEVLALLAKKRNAFTRWEQLRLDEIRAIENKKWIEAALLDEQLYEMDPSDLPTLNRGVTLFNRANYPERSLALLAKLDRRFLPDGPEEIRWQDATEAFPNLILGNYQRVAEIAQNYDLPKFPDALAVMHLQALVNLDSLERIPDIYDRYLERGVYTTSGKPTPIELFLPFVCDELLLKGKIEVLADFTKRLTDYAHENPGHSSLEQILGYAAFYRGNYSEALKAWEKETVHTENWPGWMHFPLTVEHLSRLGYCYVKTGDEGGVEKILGQIFAKKGEHPDLVNVQSYYQARILAAQGKKEAAVASLVKAEKNGFYFFRPAAYGYDPFLKELHGFEPFEALIKPKG